MIENDMFLVIADNIASSKLLEVTQSSKEVSKKRMDINGKSIPCSSTRTSLCSTQIVNTQTFLINRQKKRSIYFTN